MLSQKFSQEHPVSPQTTARSRHLNAMIERARSREQLNAMMNACLPHALQGHVSTGGIVANQLTLLIPTPAMLTILRYQQSALLTAIQSLEPFQHIKQLTIKVSPNLTIQAHTQRERKYPKCIQNNAYITHLSQCAESIEHPGLKNAMQKLARTLTHHRTHRGFSS